MEEFMEYDPYDPFEKALLDKNKTETNQAKQKPRDSKGQSEYLTQKQRRYDKGTYRIIESKEIQT